MWSSRAASHSRVRIRSLEATTLARVTDDLAQVRWALDRRGRELDEHARAQRQHADRVDITLAVAALGDLGAGGFA